MSTKKVSSPLDSQPTHPPSNPNFPPQSKQQKEKRIERINFKNVVDSIFLFSLFFLIMLHRSVLYFNLIQQFFQLLELIYFIHSNVHCVFVLLSILISMEKKLFFAGRKIKKDLSICGDLKRAMSSSSNWMMKKMK